MGENANGFIDATRNQTQVLSNSETNELQAILTPSAEVCLLRDSPFRILRVSTCNILMSISQ